MSDAGSRPAMAELFAGEHSNDGAAEFHVALHVADGEVGRCERRPSERGAVSQNEHGGRSTQLGRQSSGGGRRQTVAERGHGVGPRRRVTFQRRNPAHANHRSPAD